MKKVVKVVASLICLFIMLNMTTIEADNSSLIITADLRVLDNKTTAYLGEEVRFDAFFTQGPWQSLVFYFHDGTDPLVTSQPQVSHRFNIEGKFLVTLMAIGVGGISDSASIEITVINEQPFAGILMPITAKEGENVTLKAIDIQDTPNDISQLRFRWVLGDGNIKEGVEIKHAWTASGNYTVTLQVLDEHLAMNYATAEISITNVPPIANFGIWDSQNIYKSSSSCPYIATEEDLLDFDATSSQDSVSDYEPLQFYWDFGDGSVGRGSKLHHTYHESGIYNVKLLVQDDDGVSSSATQLIIVQNLAPTINLIADNVLLQEGQTYIFETDSQDTSTDFQRLSYLWSFGGIGWRESHVWSDNWSGEVNVQVQDPEGLVDTDSTTVQVQNVPPKASISMVYVEGDLTLKAAGTAGNTIELKFYGNNEVLYNLTLDRIPGDPKSQEKSLHFVMDLSINWHIEISYATPIDGSNPTWLTFNFADHSSYSHFHNFIVDQPDTWVWNIFPQNYLFSRPITFNGTIFDPGSDSISGEIKLNSVLISEIEYQNDGTWPVEIPFEVTVQLPTEFFLPRRP